MTRRSPEERASLLERAKKMREAGVTWTDIAAEFRCSRHFLQSNIDPAYSDEKRKAKERERRRQRSRELGLVGQSPHLVVPFEYVSKRTQADAIERLKEIPPDTRSITGILMGDPLPTRSALDQERRQ